MSNFSIDVSRLNSKLDKVAAALGKGMQDTTLEVARRFTRSVLDWTPPANGTRNGSRQSLENRITGDLAGKKGKPNGIFIGVKPASKKRRRQEKYPDLAAELTHHPVRNNGRSWRRPRPHQKRYVFKAKLARAIVAQKRKVGRQAAGWLSAATLLGVKMPSYITRHGNAEGRINIESHAGVYRIIITNAVPYNKQILARLATLAAKRTGRGLDVLIDKVKTTVNKHGHEN